MNQEKIIQAIADVINKKGTDDFGMLPWCKPSDLIAELAAAIAPHLEAESGWEDAPSWAEWRTVDKHGAVLYWENEPVPDDENGFWVHRINDVDGVFEYSNHLADWKNCKQKRPR